VNVTLTGGKREVCDEPKSYLINAYIGGIGIWWGLWGRNGD